MPCGYPATAAVRGDALCVTAAAYSYVPSLGPVRAAQQRWRSTADELLRTSGSEANAVQLAMAQGFVLTRADARACGLAERDARRLVRRKSWTSPRHGVLTPLPPTGDGPSGSGPELAATAAALVWSDTVISYASGAALHCLPLLAPPGPPAMTADREHRACSREDVRLHIAALPLDEVTTWFGAPVTSVERTIVDLARARGVRAGVVAADAALHEHLTTPDALHETADRQRGWPGVRAARAAVDLADGRAESPLESLTRLCLLAGGLPKPELQLWVETAGGAFRVDMLYVRERVIVECDGLLKYRNDPAALVEEKRRQEYLARAGFEVVRVLWADVTRHPELTCARVGAALLGR
jgi:very-short-patch-repair endonuclease